MTEKRPAVFLDRDGTINLDAGYIDRLERFELYPFAIDAIRLFKQAGYLVVILTNQAGVAHGMYGEDFVATLAEYLADRARAGGGQIDGHYYCPHSPDAAVPALPHRLRVPQAEARHGAAGGRGTGHRSAAVGRHRRPVARLAVARAVGCRGILVKTGYGATEAARPQPGLEADAVCDDLIGAAVWLLDHPVP